MTDGGETLTLDQLAVLRALLRFKGKPVSGEELLERIFATTSEVPLDGDKVSRAVTSLAETGHVELSGDGPPDPGFSFVYVAITKKGLSA